MNLFENQINFFNKLVKTWLFDNNILMYMTHNGCKSVIAERFIKNLKSKTYQKMTADASNPQIEYFDGLDNE